MSLGEAYVTARIDTTGFAKDAKTKLDAELKTLVLDVVNVRINPDLKGFRERIKAATELLPVEVHVRADTDALAEQLAAATRDRALVVRARLEGLDDTGEAITIPVRANVENLRQEIFEVQSHFYRNPLRISANTFELKAELEKLRKDGIEIPVGPKLETGGRRAFTASAQALLEGMKPVKIPVTPDVTNFRSTLQTLLAGKDTDAFDINLTTSTAKLRTLIQKQFDLQRFRIQIDQEGGEGPTGAKGYNELSAAADRATASIRRQIAALQQAGAEERDVLSLLRRELAELQARAAALNIDVPVDIDSTTLAAELERAVEAAERSRGGIDVPILADLTALRAQLASLGRGAASEPPLTVPIVGDLTPLRTQLEALTGSTAESRPVEVPIVADLTTLQLQFRTLDAELPEGGLEVPVRADLRVLQEQLVAIRASRAIEIPVIAQLQFLRFQLQSLTVSEAVKVPVVADLAAFRASFEREFAGSQGRQIVVEVDADLRPLRKKLLDATTAGLFARARVIGDTEGLRAQLAAFGSFAPVKIPLAALPGSLASMHGEAERYFAANPVKVDIEARLEPGNLKQLRTQAGRLASVNVKATIDPDEFRDQLIAAGRAGIRVKIIAADIVKFRNEIRAFFERLPALIEILPANIVTFRRAVQAALRNVPARINVLPGNLQAFRDEVRAVFATQAGVGVNIRPANLPEFRRLVREALAAPPFPVNIRPVVDPAAARAATAAAGRAGDAAGKSFLERINKAFSFAFGSLGKNFRRLERGFVQFAAIGEAAFVGVGVAGLALGSKIELLNISLQNLAEATQAAFEAGDIGLDDTLLGENVKTLEEVTAKVDALQGRIVKFAQESPLGVDAVSDAVIRLSSSLDVTGDQALAQIKAISGALAISPENLNAEGLSGVVKALTQIAAAGKLGGQELLQLSNRIPVLARSEIFANLAKQIVGAKDAIKGVDAETIKLTNSQLQQVKKLQRAGRFDANQALRAILESLEKTPGAENALERFNESLTGTIQRIKETLQFEFGSLFLEILQPVAKSLEKASKTLIPAIRDSGFVEAFKEQFDEVVKILTAVAPVVFKSLVSIGEAFTNLFASIGPGGFEAIGQAIAGTFNFINTLITNTVQAIQRFRDFITGTSTAAFTLRNIFENIGTILGNILPIAENVLSALYDGFQILAPVILPVVEAFYALEAGLTTILASDFGAALFTAAAIAAAAYVAAIIAVNLQFLIFIARAALANAALLVTAANTFRATVAMVGFGAASAAAARGGIAALVARLGPLGAAIAAGVVAFEVGRRGVQKLAFAFGLADDPAERFQATLNGVTVKAKTTQGVIDGLRKKLGDLPADTKIDITDNFNNVTNRLVVLSDQARATAAEMRRLGYTIAQVSAASIAEFEMLKAAQDASRGLVSGPLVEGQTRQQLTDTTNLANLGLDKFGIPESKGFEDAADKAKTEAEKAAEKFADAIKDLVLDIDRNIRQQLIEGSAESVKKTLNDLRDKIIDVFKEAGKDVPSGLLRRIRLDNKVLQRLARERDRILEELKAAEAKFSQTRDAALAFGGISNVIDAATSSVAKAGKTLRSTLEATTLDVAGSFQVIRKRTNEAIADQETTDRVAVTTRNLLAAFKDRLKVLRDFNADIKKLAERGLDKQIIDDLITAGPEASAETADVLANASKKTISEFNKVQGQLEDQAKKLGATATNSLFRQGEDFATGVLATLRTSRDATKAAITKLVDGLLTDVKSALVQGKAVDVGVDIVRGIVKGLKSWAPAVRKEIRDLIDDLVAEVKDRLQIKSPSRVMEGLGAHAVQGLANGLSNSGVVKSAAAGLAGAVSSLDMSIPELSTLLNLSTTEAEAALARLQLPNLDASVLSKMPQSTKVDVDHLVRQREESAAARQQQIDYARLEGVMRMARSQTVYQQPITQHFQHPVTPQQAAVDVTRIRVGR